MHQPSELAEVPEVFYSSSPRTGACSGWTGRGQRCSWAPQPGFRWVSPPASCVSQAQPSGPSLSSAPAREQRVLPEQEMLLRVRLGPQGPVGCAGRGASFPARPRVPSCAGCKAAALPLPAHRASRSRVQSISEEDAGSLPRYSEGSGSPGSSPSPADGVVGGSPCPQPARGSPLRPLSRPKQIDFIFPFVNKGGESSVS